MKSHFSSSVIASAALLSLLLSSPATLAEPQPAAPVSLYPAETPGYVTDIAGFLNPEQLKEIEGLLRQTESSSGVEIRVVAINSIKDYPGTDNSSIENFATGLFNQYRIGHTADSRGILFLIAKRDGLARIQLGNGYPETRNADAQGILDRIILPQFNNREFAAGIKLGVEELVKEFAGQKAAQ